MSAIAYQAIDPFVDFSFDPDCALGTDRAWPKGDLADKAVCEAIGNSEGIFTDYAAAKHGCGTRGERSSTNAQGGSKFDDVNPGVPRNYTWHVLKKSAFFAPNGQFDRELAEYAMSLIGTIIYVPPMPLRRRSPLT